MHLMRVSAAAAHRVPRDAERALIDGLEQPAARGRVLLLEPRQALADVEREVRVIREEAPLAGGGDHDVAVAREVVHRRVVEIDRAEESVSEADRGRG